MCGETGGQFGVSPPASNPRRSETAEGTFFIGCDLMLFDYRFQSQRRADVLRPRCDLMLFDYRFQYWTLSGLY